MKKKTFAKLALLGITNGLFLSTLSAANDARNEAQATPLQFATLLAAKCSGSGGCSGVVASKCSGSGGCSGVVASKCSGSGGCSGVVASKCSGSGGCGGVVASKCGSGSCNAIAERDPSDSPTLQAPQVNKKNSALAKDQSKNDTSDPNSENLGYHLMTEDELLLQLNDQATKQYKALSPEGKALARQVASQRCQGTNDCKGLNACQTDSNQCAGQGSCKSQTKCAFSDKNVVIKLVTKKMAEKRASSLQK